MTVRSSTGGKNEGYKKLTIIKNEIPREIREQKETTKKENMIQKKKEKGSEKITKSVKCPY